jgi:CubicO group peptidase (beta-lactamase class C family)
MTLSFPDTTWDRIEPEEAGFDAELLSVAREDLETTPGSNDPRALDTYRHDNPYRVVIVRGGKLVAEWNQGIEPGRRVRLRSATKSIFSSILGIASEEGMVSSPDDKVVEYFPEAVDVLPGEGPKTGRHGRHKDRDITLRQLVANTSGYLKPDEAPGEVKHYQTYGMNVLTHAIASKYGMYDVSDPEGSPGFKLLIDSRLRIPIHASWTYYRKNFDLHEDAKLANFGYFPGVAATARDMARLGWLWCNYGRWKGEQLVPEAWMRESVSPAPAERDADPESGMLDGYGLGFWTNAAGALWPSLPTDSFAALGAGGIAIWMCPSLRLSIVEGPGPFHRSTMGKQLFPTVVEAVEQNA